MPVVYSLTELTGRKRNENRRMVVMTFEVRRHTFLIICAAFIAAVPVAGILAVLVDVWRKQLGGMMRFPLVGILLMRSRLGMCLLLFLGLNFLLQFLSKAQLGLRDLTLQPLSN